MQIRRHYTLHTKRYVHSYSFTMKYLSLFLLIAATALAIKITSAATGTECPPLGSRCLLIKCAYGMVIDDNGCTTCKCNRCPLLDCLKYIKCAYGIAHDDNGCPKCGCNASPQIQLIDSSD
ncbi:unnamed protein product [Didymodactylos carnosus]|uniref:Antistasin-like domain-containing protein n=1 Tax=Didymodactylos carnosus TaxID=1234261 RepID=A0A814Z5H2_9BILA|nr:unnamed protein product [Didymodactylos carnosus]CAF1238410.1 unnamed protein product [Didymodactylos carnosus]CAF4000560.1 unnamed protein product [Didymodactylos carnosus]CAF4044585.1 unnamed protein product [Didymodactylos carnosus]